MLVKYIILIFFVFLIIIIIKMVSHTIRHDRILKSHLIISENKQGAIRSSRIYKNLKKNNSNENLKAGLICQLLRAVGFWSHLSLLLLFLFRIDKTEKWLRPWALDQAYSRNFCSAVYKQHGLGQVPSLRS